MRTPVADPTVLVEEDDPHQDEPGLVAREVLSHQPEAGKVTVEEIVRTYGEFWEPVGGKRILTRRSVHRIARVVRRAAREGLLVAEP